MPESLIEDGDREPKQEKEQRQIKIPSIFYHHHPLIPAVLYCKRKEGGRGKGTREEGRRGRERRGKEEGLRGW